MISFFTGLLIARELSPSGYGDLSFLLGSFVAVKTLLDLGTSNAFYTFISQRPRSRSFYLFYFLWLGLQFIITTLFLAVLTPQSLIDKVWLGHSRTVILLTFVASFMQQQVWQTISQVGESSRKTIKVQVISQTIAVVHLVFIVLLVTYHWISITSVLWLIIAEYVFATFWAFWFLRDNQHSNDNQVLDDCSPRRMFNDYWTYCQPLVLLSLIGFIYEFADRWLLQRFGGANQQGFYQVAYQFSSISLLATTSIINVFWKEIAEAQDLQNQERVSAIYHRVNRGLVMIGAVLSGLLIPWTGQIVAVFLGQPYAMAVPALMIMFLYPIPQSMGQIAGTMLLASGHTRTYTLISISIMLVSLPLSYLILAPTTGQYVAGMGGGATLIAAKLVLLAVLSVNILAWFIARHHKWKYDWFYQVIGIGSALLLGYLSTFIVGFFWSVHENDRQSLLLSFLATGLLYSCAVALLLFFIPGLIGMSRNEMRTVFIKLYKFISTFPDRVA